MATYRLHARRVPAKAIQAPFWRTGFVPVAIFMEADLHGMGCLLKQRAAWKGGRRCQVGSDL